MFTGLIEEIGRVAYVKHNASGSRIAIQAKAVLESLKKGDSIAVDGVCTTVVLFDSQGFTVEASPETVERTNFKHFKSGIEVNLERPLTPASRIGGHYVTGHVDGQAKLVLKERKGISILLEFELEDDELAQYVVQKGSVAISGISLTVNRAEGNRFSVAIIPHTLENTNLSNLDIGNNINIETDLLGKYVKKLLSTTLKPSQDDTKSSIDEQFLIQHGFLSSSR